MSWHATDDPRCQRAARPDPIDTLIVPRARDLGGFQVRRALPASERQMVGPFIFLDQMGPTEFITGSGIEVRPHPHIGLATVTYLFDGEILHRDSLGSLQAIRPGEVNWMTAGRGIVHSERTDPAIRTRGSRLFGLQTWVALPKAHEETTPAFSHHGVEDLPTEEGEGLSVRLVVGELFGKRAPVTTFSAMFYADASLAAGARLALDTTYEDRSLYVVSGKIQVAGVDYPAGQLLVFKPGVALTVQALEAARVMLLGGEPMDGPRHIWWNFVSSSAERIEQAKAEWRAGGFPTVPGDEQEFIPLPG